MDLISPLTHSFHKLYLIFWPLVYLFQVYRFNEFCEVAVESSCYLIVTSYHSILLVITFYNCQQEMASQVSREFWSQ